MREKLIDIFVKMEFNDTVGNQVDYLIANGVTVQRHGHWIEGLDGSVMCSECGQVIRYEIGYYCPRCGAIMNILR